MAHSFRARRSEGCNFRARSLDGAQLQGAWLDRAQLQGARLIAVQLQGAVLDVAQLHGAVLDHAQLQARRSLARSSRARTFQQADLDAVDLSDAYLWRTNRSSSPLVAAIRMSGDDWLPEWMGEDANNWRWDDRTYQALRIRMKSLPAGLVRDEALKQVQSLDCSRSR